MRATFCRTFNSCLRRVPACPHSCLQAVARNTDGICFDRSNPDDIKDFLDSKLANILTRSQNHPQRRILFVNFPIPDKICLPRYDVGFFKLHLKTDTFWECSHNLVISSIVYCTFLPRLIPSHETFPWTVITVNKNGFLEHSHYLMALGTTCLNKWFLGAEWCREQAKNLEK